MSTFLISDTHWGHANLCVGSSRWRERSRCRPFRNPREHDAYLRRKWCHTVADEDTVIVVGDWALCGWDYAERLTKELPGRKILVRGNHDRSPARMIEMGFAEVYSGPVWCAMREPLEWLQWFPKQPPPADGWALLNHYPWDLDSHGREFMRTPKGECSGDTFLIHGHTHSEERRSSDSSINMSAEAWKYKPVPLEEVVALMRGDEALVG